MRSITQLVMTTAILSLIAAHFGALNPTVPSVHALDSSHFITHTNSCFMTGRPPERPAPLQFCYWFNDNSCCVPGWDLDIQKAFVEVSDLGAGCSPSKHTVKAAYRQIRDYMCMGCDPDEHRYRFRDAIGDAHLPGGQHDPIPSAEPEAFSWRICRSWIYGLDNRSGFWGEAGKKYDKCGVQLLNDCGAIKQVSYDPTTGDWVESDVPILDGWDPGMCAGDVIFPALEFGDSEVPAERLLQIIPQFINDFKFVVTDDFNETFSWEDTPCFRGGSASSFHALAIVIVTLIGLLGFTL